MLKYTFITSSLFLATSFLSPIVHAADRTPANLTAAVANPARPDADKTRDMDRKPAETLAFAGVKPGQNIVELFPGGGYFTRVLSKAVGPKGHIYAVWPSTVSEKAIDGTKALAADPAYSNVTLITQPQISTGSQTPLSAQTAKMDADIVAAAVKAGPKGAEGQITAAGIKAAPAAGPQMTAAAVDAAPDAAAPAIASAAVKAAGAAAGGSTTAAGKTAEASVVSAAVSAAPASEAASVTAAGVKAAPAGAMQITAAGVNAAAPSSEPAIARAAENAAGVAAGGVGTKAGKAAEANVASAAANAENSTSPGVQPALMTDWKLQTPPADMVWTAQNYHDFHNMKNSDVAALNNGVYNALKHGGYYIIVDHAATPGSGINDTATLHRIDVEAVKKEVESSGFVLDNQSDILKNPNDTHSVKVTDASIAGKTDRFILKFRKP